MRKIKSFMSSVILVMIMVVLITVDVKASPEEDTDSMKVQQYDDGGTRIHYIGIKASVDAILLESNGRFAMVDASYGWDYPDGSDPRYPNRDDSWSHLGWDIQVINYLDRVGVTEDNFDFFIASHAHSDHIGAADTVIRKYKPETVYAKYYDDSEMDCSDGNFQRLSDTQFVYDGMIQACEDVGTNLIQEMTEGMTIEFGDMTIEFLNAAHRTNLTDLNDDSLTLNVYIGETKTVLAGDTTPKILKDLYDNGHFADVNIVKLSHHGHSGSGFPNEILGVITPEEAICTGFETASNIKFLNDLGIKVYLTTKPEAASWITEYSSNHPLGYITKMGYMDEGWFDLEGNSYYIRKNGVLAGTGSENLWFRISGNWYYCERGKIGLGRTAKGWFDDQGKKYYLDPDNRGAVQTGWKEFDNGWYYFERYYEDIGVMQTGWIKDDDSKYYYLRPDGIMKFGWLEEDGDWYFLDRRTGAMRKGWVQEGLGEWYFMDYETGIMVSNEWIGNYWFGSDGAMVTGWAQDGDDRYFLNEARGIVKGWIEDGEDWYFMDYETGIMVSNEWIGGYWLGSDGRWIPDYER